MKAEETIRPPAGMVYVPPGPFLMGCTAEETDPDPFYPEMDSLASARPQRSIYLSGYFIDMFPVTNRQYKEFIDDTGYDVPSPPEDLPHLWGVAYWDRTTRSYLEGLDDCPVVMVTYYDALAYCEWAGKRLPTEAEWEKAARGTDGRPYPWGWEEDFEQRCNVWDEAAWTNLAPLTQVLRPVNAYPNGVSPYGCFDMLGNVHEWCSDWYDDAYYATMPARNPRGPRTPKHRWRVVRGCGCYWSSALHVAVRDAKEPWGKNFVTGFRCALSLQGEEHSRKKSSSREALTACGHPRRSTG